MASAAKLLLESKLGSLSWQRCPTHPMFSVRKFYNAKHAVTCEHSFLIRESLLELLMLMLVTGVQGKVGQSAV